MCQKLTYKKIEAYMYTVWMYKRFIECCESPCNDFAACVTSISICLPDKVSAVAELQRFKSIAVLVSK